MNCNAEEISKNVEKRGKRLNKQKRSERAERIKRDTMGDLGQ